MGRSKIPSVHESLKAVGAFQFAVPVPPSTNQLFAGNGKRRYRSDKYTNWRLTADAYLKALGIKAVPGPVIVQIAAPRNNRRDLDNYCKPILDLCVRHGIIESDNGRIVQEIILGWQDSELVNVEIRKAYDWIQRRNAASAA